MPDTEILHGREQRAALDGICVIIFERIVIVLRSDQSRREMDDRLHLVARNRPRHRLVISAVAEYEAHSVGDCPWYAIRHVVDYDRLLAGVEQPEHHVPADVSRA